MKLFHFLIFIPAISIVSCSKSSEPDIDICMGKTQPVAQFAFKEIVGDTAFYADTVYNDNIVQFTALDSYDSLKWKVGNDPRVFSQKNFSLNFINTIVSIPVTFTGYNQPNHTCFPNDNGIYTGTKQLTTVEQFDRATLTKSPMIGRYKGAFTDTPADTFTVRIDYFDSAKYNTAHTGARNFYWISNIPKGYIDSTSDPAIRYPELRNGMAAEMGYKALVFSGGFDIRGNGWLIKDSLFINYIGYNLTRQKKFIGKRL